MKMKGYFTSLGPCCVVDGVEWGGSGEECVEV